MTERKKRILIFAHYYAPDTASTGQILRDLAEGLREEFEVTPLPFSAPAQPGARVTLISMARVLHSNTLV